MGIDAVMKVVTQKRLTDEQLKQLRYDLGDAFGPERFFLSNRFGVYHAIDRDGTANGLTVNLGTRYYGPEYERGDAVTILMLAHYLRVKLPLCEVWYGGDSDDKLTLLTDSAWTALFSHFVDNGHKPYRTYGTTHDTALFYNQNPPMCDFCEFPMIQNGFGPHNYANYYCSGCGQEIEQNGNVRIQKVEVGGKQT